MCACISQPEYGFRYALMVWQMSLKFKCRPDLNMYELLLKAAKDCSICSKKELVHLPKPEKVSSKLLKQVENESTQKIESQSNSKDEINDKLNSSESIPVENESMSSEIVQLDPSDIQITNPMRIMGEELSKEMRELEWWQDLKTNVDRDKLLQSVSRIRPELRELILARNFDSLLTRKIDETERENLFSFVTNEDDTPAGRLYMCTGGIDGLLKAMRAHSVEPSLKTFQILVHVWPKKEKKKRI